MMACSIKYAEYMYECWKLNLGEVLLLKSDGKRVASDYCLMLVQYIQYCGMLFCTRIRFAMWFNMLLPVALCVASMEGVQQHSTKAWMKCFSLVNEHESRIRKKNLGNKKQNNKYWHWRLNRLMNGKKVCNLIIMVKEQQLVADCWTIFN